MNRLITTGVPIEIEATVDRFHVSVEETVRLLDEPPDNPCCTLVRLNFLEELPMQPPIIGVDSSGDVLIFSSLQAVERYFEPIHVPDGEYVIYDARGCALAASVAPRGVASRSRGGSLRSGANRS